MWQGHCARENPVMSLHQLENPTLPPPFYWTTFCCLFWFYFQVVCRSRPLSVAVIWFCVSPHPNSNGGVHPLVCSFMAWTWNFAVVIVDWIALLMTLNCWTIDWLIDCINYWLIEFIYWLIDWLIEFVLVTFVHLRLPSAQFAHLWPSHLIDWLLRGRLCGSPQPSPRPRSPIQ